MATTIDTTLFPAAAPVAARRRWIRDADIDRAMLPLMVVFLTYATRDALTGVFRYWLPKFHLAGVWFLPDLMSFMVMAYFIWVIAFRRQSAWAILFSASVFVSTIIGWIFMSSSPVALLSSVKMMSPFFVGLAFVGRSLAERKWACYFMFALSVISTVGLLGSPLFDYPWVGMAVETFGQTKAVGRVWWSGGAIRYGGFAGDSTMAAYMCLFPLIIVHRHISPKLILLMAGPVGLALHLATSKTAIACGVLFALYYVFVVLLGRKWGDAARELHLTRLLAKWSFVLVPLPFILMLALGGTDLTQIDPMLFSMQDRINSTWVFPFVHLGQNFPIGLVTGCGLGCFTYPMEYTRLGYLMVPVDNFYIATYVMLGAPFILFVVGMFTATIKSNDREKLTLIALLNVYVVTIQCYGPSTATIVMGYAFSDMFLTLGRTWTRRNRAKVPD
ncbi:hypothetical protein [uncultured Sphingomonas sp.]|uniref:hypothetical protein n=1 Tax=uncultured Sphingomonas sp. TaxID=158754 RepID=UPI0025EE9627|nr:hypothetical protein [uncultured Sphingomonas sp.]